MRCFITGASGQLGSALLRRLAQAGHELTALVLPDDLWAGEAFAGFRVEQLTGDVLLPESLPQETFDWVFHLAADQSFWRGHERRQRALNIGGVESMLAWAQRFSPTRFVHVSSLAAVGVAPGPDAPIDETFPFNGADLGLMYFQTKHAGEQLVRQAARGGLPAVIANPGTVLGPWDRGRHAARLLKPFVRGRLRGVPGGGINVVDTRDVADGLLAAAERGRAGERYLLTGHNLTYRELAVAVCRVAGVSPPRLTYPGAMLRALAVLLEPIGRLTGWEPPVSPDDVTVGTRFLYFDNRKARAELGLSVRPLDQTLRDSLRWYRESGLWD